MWRASISVLGKWCMQKTPPRDRQSFFFLLCPIGARLSPTRATRIRGFIYMQARDYIASPNSVIHSSNLVKGILITACKSLLYESWLAAQNAQPRISLWCQYEGSAARIPTRIIVWIMNMLMQKVIDFTKKGTDWTRLKSWPTWTMVKLFCWTVGFEQPSYWIGLDT